MEGVPIRRTVTGHDSNRGAKVLHSDVAKNARRPREGVVSTLLWCTDDMPASIPIGEDIEDMGDRTLDSAPPANGTRFIVLEFSPGVGSAMHGTKTIDYITVISGTIDMELPSSTLRLAAGETLIQRGTIHAWINRGDVLARLSIVMVDAKPLDLTPERKWPK
jgi:quercetin dioxygenase-like cupin family protein